MAEIIGNKAIQATSGNTTVSVQVQYNAGATIQTPMINVTWVDILSILDGDDNTFTYTLRVYQNTGLQRHTIITFLQTDGSSDFVYITQAGSAIGTDVITTASDVFLIPSIGETFDITLYQTYPIQLANCTVDVDWCSASVLGGTDSDDGTERIEDWKISVLTNRTNIAREGHIVFSTINGMGETGDLIITILQEPSYIRKPQEEITDAIYSPIWKDVEYDFGNIDQVEYSIFIVKQARVGQMVVNVDELVFTGRSTKKPNSDHNIIMVNKICQNYLTSPELSDNSVGTYAGFETFKLKSVGEEITYQVYRFVNDWSYDEFNTGLLSHRILNKRDVVRGQMLPFSVYADNTQVGIPNGITYGDGSVWNNTVYEKNGVYTEFFPPKAKVDGAVSYWIDGTTFPIVDNCKIEYVLYYVNPWGGMDWFPIEGKTIVKDNVTQYTYTQNYNNTTMQFGKRRYLSEINRNYELHTGYLSEDESSRMWYLLQSNTVYLHKLKENKIIPVVITNTETEHKRRGLISSRINYVINVEESQTRQRL